MSKIQTVLVINGLWRIARDENQWIIQRCRTRNGVVYWDAVAFVGSTTEVLLRILAVRDIPLTPEQRAQIEGWPRRFLDQPRAVIPKPAGGQPFRKTLKVLAPSRQVTSGRIEKARARR